MSAAELLTLTLVLVELLRGLRGQCVFPKFLRMPMADGKDPTWTSETKFIDNTNLWDTQLEITVAEMDIKAKLKYKAQCHEYTGTVPCFQRELHYSRVCMQEEDGGKYRVQHHDKGRTYYLCMKFVPRNKNIVQVWSSPPREANHNELCGEHLMQRELWPWFAPKLEEWSFSPIVGGFDFTTFMYERSKKLCHSIWRPSRMETECVRGEGISFKFPEKSCSPFMNHRQELTLQVWGHWIEDDFQFIVAAEPDKQPQFVLRFPRDLEMNIELTVELYFSPVCPNERRYSRPAGLEDVLHAELHMKRGEPGICYDESDQCVKHAKEGKCTNSALHEYANYCKRSCGLCRPFYPCSEFSNTHVRLKVMPQTKGYCLLLDLLPSTRPECRFPGNIRKDWFLFETDREERVRIHGGHLAFSTLGEFICKSKHWAFTRFKLLSYYTNGCRPRYTCVHFNPDTDGTTLQFQISKSETTDRSFKLCDFKNDPEPLGGLIRSSEYKILVSGPLTSPNSCGLRGTIDVNVTLPRGHRCSGQLSDWDEEICAIRPRLQLTLYRCLGRFRFTQEFECKAYVNLAEGRSFLITQNPETKIFSCWVIYTYPERMNYKPWKSAYRLTRAQCGMEEENDPSVPRDSDLQLQVPHDRISQRCPKNEKTPAPSPSPRTQTKDIRATEEDERKDQGQQQYLGSAAQRTSASVFLYCLSAVIIAFCCRHWHPIHPSTVTRT